MISIGLLVAVMHAVPGSANVGVANAARPKALTQKIKARAPKLTDAERVLIAGSRKAIVQTGLSEAYFDRHFTMAQVVNQPGDRRVVWRFSVGEFATMVADVLGYYTREDGKRLDTHSVTTTLGTTRDIERTISRRAADQFMRQCIGSFRNPSIEYRVADGGARLLMTAESIPKSARRKSEEREGLERQSRANQSGVDVIESEGHDPPIVTGTVDLQTGKCTKGEQVVAP